MASGGEKIRRKLWKDEDMVSAMEAVSKKELTVSEAARVYHVPRKTLDDRVKGRVLHGTKPGRDTVLTAEEESSLCNYLVYMAERGFPLTRHMVMAFAWAVALRSGKAKRFNPELGPGDHWWSNFRARHPELTLRKADKLDRNRAESLDPDVVSDYFELLKKTLTDHGLMNSPRRLYNCDETFLPLDGTREKVVTVKKAKYTYAQAHGTTEHITLLCGASAAGIALPPMIIYPKAFPGGPYTFRGPDDAVYAKSESGWVDSELFLGWMKRVFLVYAVPQRPVILFIDGHKTHMTLDLIDMARSSGVILFCLPPHTTHALQPLDVAVFKSLKDNFFKSVRALSFAKKNFVVSKREFASVVKGPFEKSFSMSNIKAGFSKSGIFPYNPGAIAIKKMKPSEVYKPLQNSSLDSVDTSTSEDTSLLAPDTPSPVVSSIVSHPTPNSPSSSPGGAPLTSTPSRVPNTPTPLTVTPQPSSSSGRESSIVNPLVATGMVPAHLADIFCTPEMDPQSQPTKRRRITKARILTENEYIEMMKEKDAKEREAEELKRKRKEERERKKEEREKQKREKEEERQKKKEERENAKKEREEARKAKQPQSRKGKTRALNQDSDSLESDLEEPTESRRPCRVRQLPARFRDESSGSDSDECTLCNLCNAREPASCKSSIVFWVDCSECGSWFHTACALGDNNASRPYLCESCL